MRVMQSTSEKGLDHSLLPMRLYHKAKVFGVWNPKDIDLTRDKEDWEKFDEIEREMTLRLCSMFQAGEEAVTRDLLPLIRIISLEGRLEEEMFLTTFLWEEAKHTEMFRRFLDEVAGVNGDLSVYHLDNYRKLFYEYLPQAMERLIHDPSPEAQAEASVTYNMIVEGVLAETGYYSTFTSFKRLGLMPGTVKAFEYLQRDESRHIAYGIYLLQRLITEHDHVWDVVSKRMEFLLPTAIGVVNELIGQVEVLPFGLDKNEMIQYAMKQFDLRMNLLERARGKSAEELFDLSEETMETVREEF